MSLRVILLSPLAFLYRVITGFRNHLYNIGYTRSFNYDIMTLTVGNLSVGGTGKTPMVEYLVKYLKTNYAVATLSRGYKRKTSGFLLAETGATAEQLGDEPYQLFSKFKQEVTVAVGEDRALAIPKILMQHPETQVIVLDDAYQHRAVRADFNLLLTAYHAPFYNDYVLPSGNLRESRAGAQRADAIIVTKCPNELPPAECDAIKKQIERYAARKTPVYFTAIHYGVPVAFNPSSQFSGKLLLFAGLANMQPLETYVASSFILVKSVPFADHHDYSPFELEKLKQEAVKLGAQLLTTEKDMAKIRSNPQLKKIFSVDLFYLPISVQFLFNQDNAFNEQIARAIKTKYTVENERAAGEQDASKTDVS